MNPLPKKALEWPPTAAASWAEAERGMLARLNPAARLLRGAEDDVDPDDLLLKTAFDMARKSGEARRWLAGALAETPEHDGGHRHDPNRHGGIRAGDGRRT